MATAFKVLSWNLNHRSRVQAVPGLLPEVFDGLGVDLVLLNEFVDHPFREPFRTRLCELGYAHQAISPCIAGENQIFAASRIPITLGDLRGPDFGPASLTNWLHLRVGFDGLEVIGLRFPWYVRRSDRRFYRAALCAVLGSAADRSLLVTGDLNEDPFEHGDPGATSVQFAGVEALTVPRPTGPWSYSSSSGTSFSRIDHVMHTAQVTVVNATYHYEADGLRLAGRAADGAISDHAALTFTVGRRKV